mmetsp:Transcript_6971/g.13275  ORF Transcript_6971/g.13275 Transcript_6971/m.13275 type:complete len:404 (+) Transcript_6971:787-1998(+)
MPVVYAVDPWPLRPRVVLGTFIGGKWEQLQVGDAECSVANRGSNAVGTGVTSTDHNYVLSFGADVFAVLQVAVKVALGVGSEEVHGEVDALQSTTGSLQIPGNGGTGGEDHSVVHRSHRLSADDLFGRFHVVGNFLCIRFADHGCSRDELNAGVLHKLDAPFHHVLFVEFHVGDPVHEKPSNAVFTLENSDSVPGLVKLVSGCETCGSGAHHSDALSSARGRDSRLDPALLESGVDDGVLDVLDGDRVFGDAKHTSTLARRWAHSPSELGEVVGLGEAVVGLLPSVVEHEVVPFRDLVTEGATGVLGVAVWDTALHAAGGLGGQLLHVRLRVDFKPILGALLRVTIRDGAAFVQHESFDFVGVLHGHGPGVRLLLDSLLGLSGYNFFLFWFLRWLRLGGERTA